MTFDTAAKTMGRQPIELVNIETDSCSLSFGVGACTAAAGEPCYNTWATCTARLAYVNTVKSYRFARSNAALPVGYSCLPLLQSVQYAPQVLTPAKGLGVRASVTVRCIDTDWPDTADDPYFDQRPTGTEGQGTFFGRFRARNPFMFGRFLHVKTGYVVDGVLDEANLQTRSYIIESITGADRSGTVTFTAKDVLKLADDDKAQCPRVTSARLDADITDAATTLIVYPAGIGNTEFPASGVLRIASELMTFTRSGDTFTLSRGQYSTQAKAAKADDAIQLCAVFVNQPVQNLIYDLLVNYAKIPAAYIDKPAWNAERDAHLLGVYSSVITDPVGVNALIGELSEQGQCYVWWDDVARLIRFKALTAPPSDLPVLSDEDHFLHGSIAAGEATAERQSRFLIRFDRIDPTKKLDDVANFRQRFVAADLQSEGEREYRSAKTRIINSRWFNSGSLGRVQQLGAALLSRYRDPPFTFEADIDISAGVKTGDLFRVSSRLFQNAAGSRKAISMQVVESYEKTAGSVLRLKSSELVWSGEDVPVNPQIIIGADLFDVNLRDLYQAEYGTPRDGDIVTFIIQAGVLITSTSVLTPALVAGFWPAGVSLTAINNGIIAGRGGGGGNGGSCLIRYFSDGRLAIPQAATGGGGGGAAIDGIGSHPMTLINNNIIAGGGGGGGGGSARVAKTNAVLSSPDMAICGGGGGGGWPYGLGGGGGLILDDSVQSIDRQGNNGENGQRLSGGNSAPSVSNFSTTGGNGGRGGSFDTDIFGANGGSGSGGSNSNSAGAGGLAGVAIINDSNITMINNGQILGN